MMRTVSVGAAILALVIGAALVRAADDEVPSFRKRGDEEKRFVAKVGEAIIKAAHQTAKNIGYLKHEYTFPKPNRTELTIKMEYHGKVTNKRYVSDIVVKIDSSNKNDWEVLNIEYADSNTTIKHNEQKVQNLIKEFNRK
jgi:hypothetical protein